MTNLKNLSFPIIFLLTAALFFAPLSFGQYANSSEASEEAAPTSEELIQSYPDIGEDSERPENKEILCPFLRMLHRAGVFDAQNQENNSKVMVSLVNLALKAREFGCRIFGCGTVGTLVSAGQVSHLGDLFRGDAALGYVNIAALHKARGVAHECGFTFEKGGTAVSDEVRGRTLERLEELTDSEGHLKKEDILKVKLEICEEQGVSISRAGAVEVDLIFIYLGGEDRGYIDFEDVVRLFHAEMPKVKAQKYL